MSQELLYTSAPRGLKPGSRGFCTVLSTQGMPAPLVAAVEGLSGYRPIYPPSDERAARNPVVYSHLKMQATGRTLHVLSRIADYGLDYSQRTNKLAHHVILDNQSERLPGGPANLLSIPGFMREDWEGEPKLVALKPITREPKVHVGVCERWKEMTGDAGWAGVVAESFLRDPDRLVILLFEPGQEVLPLFAEVLSLLPPEKRWEATFSTYFTGLATGTTCNWRAIVQDSKEAHESLRFVDALRIDLTKGLLEPARGGHLVEAARTGIIGDAPTDISMGEKDPSSPDVPSAPPRGMPKLPPTLVARPTPPAVPAPPLRKNRRKYSSYQLWLWVIGSTLTLIMAAVSIRLLTNPFSVESDNNGATALNKPAPVNANEQMTNADSSSPEIPAQVISKHGIDQQAESPKTVHEPTKTKIFADESTVSAIDSLTTGIDQKSLPTQTAMNAWPRSAELYFDDESNLIYRFSVPNSVSEDQITLLIPKPTETSLHSAIRKYSERGPEYQLYISRAVIDEQSVPLGSLTRSFDQTKNSTLFTVKTTKKHRADLQWCALSINPDKVSGSDHLISFSDFPIFVEIPERSLQNSTSVLQWKLNTVPRAESAVFPRLIFDNMILSIFDSHYGIESPSQPHYPPWKFKFENLELGLRNGYGLPKSLLKLNNNLELHVKHDPNASLLNISLPRWSTFATGIESEFSMSYARKVRGVLRSLESAIAGHLDQTSPLVRKIDEMLKMSSVWETRTIQAWLESSILSDTKECLEQSRGLPDLKANGSQINQWIDEIDKSINLFKTLKTEFDTSRDHDQTPPIIKIISTKLYYELVDTNNEKRVPSQVYVVEFDSPPKKGSDTGERGPK